MAIPGSNRRWTTRMPEVAYGMICGIGYQFAKIDAEGDYFWNIRLPIVLILGILFFHVINCISIWTHKSLIGYYDIDIHKKEMKTYAPLGLLLFFPLQRFIPNHFYWPTLSFVHFLTASLLLVLLLKCIFVLRARRKAVEYSYSVATYSVGRWRYQVVVIAIGIPLFLFHQLTLAYDSFYAFFRHGKPESLSMRHNDVTRRTFLYDEEIKLSLAVPRETTKATVGYKIVEGPKEDRAYPVSVNFHLEISDEEGKRVAEEKGILDAADERSQSWHDFEIDLSDNAGRLLHFTMKARPSIVKMDWRHLLDFLIHSPMDFQYYQSLAVSAVWSEPEFATQHQNRPNIIWISVDTLRADALGCYGYDKNVSPAIDSFARENILFTNAFSQSTWTLPSHLSMLTSRYPEEFGEFKLEGERMQVAVTKKVPNEKVRSIPVVTFPEILKEQGYYCAGFTDGV